MSDMFGAPIGIGHAERDQVALTRGALESQKTLGEIAAQPVAMENVRATTRLHNAQAGVIEAEAGDNAAAGKIMAGLGAGDGAAAAGNPTTTISQKAWAVSQKLAESGRPLAALKYAKEASALDLHGQQTVAAQASAQLRAARTQQQVAEQMGARAAQILRMPPEERATAYAQGRMELASIAGDQARNVPMTYGPEAEQFLATLQGNAVKVTDRIKMEEKVVQDKALRAKWESEVIRNRGQAGLSGVLAKSAQRRYEEEVTNGGPHSAGAVDARKVATEAKRVTMKLNERKLELAERGATDRLIAQGIKPAPPPEQREEGKVYIAPDGRAARAVMNPATRQLGLVHVVAPPPRAAAGAGRPKVSAVQNAESVALESSDDLADEGDD